MRLTNLDVGFGRLSAGTRGRHAGLCVWILAALIGPLAGCSDPAATAEDGDDAGIEDAEDLGDLSGVPAGDAAVDGDSADAKAKPDASGGTGKDALVAVGCKTDGQCQGMVEDPCRIAQCDAGTGMCLVVDLAEGATCVGLDADMCKLSPQCKAGKCLFQIVNCDDENGCTQDLCTATLGCTHDPLDGLSACTDGSACTLGATCDGETCVVKNLIICDDKNACTTDSCDPLIGCVHAPLSDGSSCDDGEPCTEPDKCQAGVCLGAPKVCPQDDNPCTASACVKGLSGACMPAVLASKFCDDGNACTLNDTCDAGGVCAGVISCDDKNPCTDDGCPDPKAGCQHINNAIPCNPVDACSGVGQCQAGQCDAVQKNCDDGNQCTNDSCDKVAGCKSVANSDPCWDGTVCTVGDACSAGACKGSSSLICDDQDPCTIDECDPLLGCSHPVAPSGTACGSGKACVVGQCIANSCGDGICGALEDNASCEGDCPQSGGDCLPSDGACLNSCKASKCAAPVKKCNDLADCQALTECLAVAGDTDAKILSCLQSASIAALQAYLVYDHCMAAWCFQNYWSGKGCLGGGQPYLDCVGACEGTMCKLLTLGCSVSLGCSAIRNCIQSCPQDGALAQCVTACKSNGSGEEALLNADLDTCSATYCQCSPATLSFPTCGI